MKKYMRLVNRGLVLFLVLILGIAVYLFVQGQEARKIKPELQKIAEAFVSDAAKYAVMPDSLKTVSANGFMESVELDRYINEQTPDLSAYYSGNEAIRDYSSMWLKMAISLQRGSDAYVISSQPKITEFKSYSMYKDKVTLTFKVADTITMRMSDGTESKHPVSGQIETITFVKEGYRWVINSYETSRITNFLWQSNW